MQRKVLPDILKGVAVLLMVQVHIMELFMLPEVYESTLGRISLFLGGLPAAAVFMSVMGYFAALSKKTIKQQITRGFILIILGFLLNICLNAHLLIRIIVGDMQIDPLPYIFGADILFLAGLSLIFIVVLKAVFGKQIWIFILMSFLVPAVSDFASFSFNNDGPAQYIMAFIISDAWWSYFPFFPWAGWVLVGYSFALIEPEISSKNIYSRYWRWLLFLPAIPMLYFLPWAFDITVNLPFYYHHGILYFTWGLAFTFYWMGLFRIIQKLLKTSFLMKYVQWLGRNVTIVYVIQWIIIGNIATALYRSQPVVTFWIALLMVLLLTSGLITLLALPVRSLRNRLL